MHDQPQRQPGSRPNVLVIVTDDQRFDTISALGNRHIHTPNLDHLAQRGFAFSRNFCTTPICTPARAEILTGCTSFTNRVTWFHRPIDPELTLLPDAFRSAGYHTVHVGKWHNDGHPRDKGYDRTHCVFPEDDLARRGHYMAFEEPGGRVEGHSSEILTDAALGALAEAPDDQPWFCYLAYFAPHDPHETPEPFSGQYQAGDMPLLPNHMPEHPFDNGDMVIRDEQLAPWPREHDAMRRYRARYYAMISHLDHHIGRLLGALQARGELEHTLIAFTGDQGLAIGSHGLLGKENMYDHSIASPAIYAGPGVPAGGRSEALAHLVDLFPTVYDLAGVDTPQSVRHGESLVDLMHGRTDAVRDAVLCEFHSPEEPRQPMRYTQRAVRTRKWKLTWYPLIDRCQLFDLEHDAVELVDLLTPWRVRRRQAEYSGQNVWRAKPQTEAPHRPTYHQDEIEAVVAEMRNKMVEQMRLHDDPLIEEFTP